VIVFAHPGHWAVQLIYLVPLIVLVGVILAGRISDRRTRAAENGPPTQRPDGPENAP